MALPLQIEIDASNGASDYGNKFGEPVLVGFTRSYGQRLTNGERREYIKPIMFSGGIGQLRDEHLHKLSPEVGMLVVKIGGPAYRIGLGGGAASSRVQDVKLSQLDFNAVQRGDAEMENKMNRALRACIELGVDNPIISIHDQGAGGNGNVLKEIVDPSGAKIDIRKVILGDSTLSVLEIWGAEFQENCALLIKPEKREFLERVCRRENVPVMFLGEITGEGRIVVIDSKTGRTEVDMDLSQVLGKMPSKTFTDVHIDKPKNPLSLPKNLSVQDCLDRVLRLLQVGSKRFLTNKVDRSVTGLVRQQQCVGPLLTPLSDVAVIAQSHFSNTGIATSIGEQPIKGLIDTNTMSRMTLGEALTNLVWAKITKIDDIKSSGNWMWASKLKGEAAAMYDACESLTNCMLELGVAVDGGKDSLSMAAKVDEEVVKAPGTLVLSLYAGVPDMSKIVTPYLKYPSDDGSKSHIIYIDLGNNKYRMGGSALAQVFGQLGDVSPDMDSTKQFKEFFEIIQELIQNDKIMSGHDRSDGGLITCILEMAFSGNCGLNINIESTIDYISYMFSEELGVCIEVSTANVREIISLFKSKNITAIDIGYATVDKSINITYNNQCILKNNTPKLRDLWEETSFQLEKLQANPECVDQEMKGLKDRKSPPYKVTFDPKLTPEKHTEERGKYKVAIIRYEGSNGDREMTSAFYNAGFEPWDIIVQDIIDKKISLKQFRGVVFVGGFSNGDVLDSAKGWSGVIRFNETLKVELCDFYNRSDTFSLGVCNGCQLSALLGFVPYQGIEMLKQPRFIHNVSGRLESRFSTVRIENSPSIMLKGMEGSVLGIIVTHGEGQCYFPDEKIEQEVIAKNLIPIKYVDDEAQPTMKYPFNPNGSKHAIAAMCSPDGRHLAMMPHP